MGAQSVTSAFKFLEFGILFPDSSLLHSEPYPNHDANLRKQYLVIYDSVPGGTGYLKQLVRGTAIFDIFQMALTHLENCTCAENPQGDGCYQCLLAYRNSRFADSISKRDACETLRELLAYKDKLVETKTLDSLTANSLYESELEKRFVEAIRRSNRADLEVKLGRQLVNGREGFFLEIGAARWTIEQQVELGATENVYMPCRADFVFRPARSSMNSKPVVVFTDGFSFHRDRLGIDCAQRTALLLSGNFWVWSLDWDDVNSAFVKQDTISFTDMVEVKWDARADKYWNHTNLSGACRIRPSENSFTLLMCYLAFPSAEQFHKVANTYGIIATFGKRPNSDLSRLPKSLWKFAKLEGAMASVMSHVANLERFFSFIHTGGASWGQVVALFNFDDGEKAKADPKFQDHWAGFLRAMNVFQFLDAFAAITKSGLEAGLFDSFDLIEPWDKKDAAETTKQDERTKLWDEEAELITNSDVLEVVDALRKTTVPVPEVGYELSLSGRVIGEVELAWIDKHVGIVTCDYADLVDQVKGDWKLFLAHGQGSADDILQCLNAV